MHNNNAHNSMQVVGSGRSTYYVGARGRMDTVARRVGMPVPAAMDDSVQARGVEVYERKEPATQMCVDAALRVEAWRPSHLPLPYGG
jgi:hypothetical protein